MANDYDVITLGSGPAGFSCAMQSSKLDKEVLVVEANPAYLGGTWINTGTVPSKALREAVKTIYEFKSQFGSDEGDKPYENFKMRDLLHFKDEILEKENRRVRENLNKNEVDIVHGFGRLVDSHTVEVENKDGEVTQYTSDYILIATGSTPAKPEKITIDHDKILDSQSLLDLTHIPRRLIIAGGGINAVEYSTIFAAMGSRITILNSRSDLLPFLDHEIKEHLLQTFKNKNINLRNNVKLEGVEFNPLRVCTEARFYNQEDPDTLEVLEAEHLLYLKGRVPKTDDIGLKKVNVKTGEQGYIKVDDSYCTADESIYAAGDVIGFPSLASASFSQGRMAACHMFDVPILQEPTEHPYGIYSIPEIAHFGMTEKEAMEKEEDITVGRAYYENITQADLSGHREGILKLIFKTDSLKLLGVHILGEQANEMIHIGQSVKAFDGDIRYFIQHVLNYPTYSQAYRTAAFNGINRVYKAGVKYRNILQ